MIKCGPERLDLNSLIILAIGLGVFGEVSNYRLYGIQDNNQGS